MDYNSTRQRLVLPEYGRHIQNMVMHAVSIEDKAERTKCAHTIIAIMGNLFPHLRDVSDFKHKLWDHLAIMSDFKLDIDYPYELPEPWILYRKPEKMPYKNDKMRFMHYGRMVEQLIEKAVLLEDETERQQLIGLIANHMKKSLMVWNKDSTTDERIFNDIKNLSAGKLKINDGFKIAEFNENGYSLNNPVQNRNKKRKSLHKNNDRRTIPHPRNNQQ